MLAMNETEKTASIPQKLFAAAAYAVTSTMIMIVNKTIFATYGFQSFLFVAMTQYSASIAVLLVQRRLGLVSFPSPWLHWRQTFFDIFPLPLLFFANTISGLGATQRLNMPLFVLLRRFSIVMTMVLEMRVLNKRFPSSVLVAVALMIIGAVIAAVTDLTVQMFGVIMILLNDAFTALQGVMLRKKMDDKVRLGSEGLMFYSNVYSLPLVCAAILVSHEERRRLAEFDGWANAGFLMCLSGSAVMGFLLNYAYFLCTKYNSPLTTTVIGAGKNIITSYVGMLFRDYSYSTAGFVGINVSVVGSIVYNWAEWTKMRDADRARKNAAKTEEGANSTLPETVTR